MFFKTILAPITCEILYCFIREVSMALKNKKALDQGGSTQGNASGAAVSARKRQHRSTIILAFE